MRYHNPVLPGMYPDPSVCAVGADYYLATSSFEYLPGIPVFHSRDMIHWEQIGHGLHDPKQMMFPEVGPSGGIYAPTIRYHQGIFYIVTTVSATNDSGHARNFFITAKDPAGPWSQPVFLAQDGIDPSLFFDEGKAYLTSNRFGYGEDTPEIQQSEIDIQTGELLMPPQVICQGTGGACTEAPHLYRRGDWYYLVCAEGGTALGHMVTVFRATSPWGPFEPCPSNPILTARDRNVAPLQATGHADFVTDAQGHDWMVFLCYRHGNGKYHHLGRETAVLPVTWPDGGWPVPHGGRVATRTVELDDESIPPPAAKVRIKDDFTDSTLGPSWNFLRTYLQSSWEAPSAWDYALDGHGLQLRGNEHTLCDVATPAFIGRRQQHFCCEVSVRVEFTPRGENEAAGLAVRMTDDAHYAFVVTVRAGQWVAAVQKTIGDMRTETYRALEDPRHVILCIRADRQKYQFGIQHADGAFLPVDTALARLISTEANWGFVGAYIGLYATGNGKPCSQPARFTQFTYDGEEDDI